MLVASQRDFGRGSACSPNPSELLGAPSKGTRNGQKIPGPSRAQKVGVSMEHVATSIGEIMWWGRLLICWIIAGLVGWCFAEWQYGGYQVPKSLRRMIERLREIHGLSRRAQKGD